MNKRKYNIEKCKKCIYRGRVSGGARSGNGRGTAGKVVNIHCNYCVLTGATCLKSNGKEELIDIRGTDYDDCKLYKKGPAIQHKPDCVVPRRLQRNGSK